MVSLASIDSVGSIGSDIAMCDNVSHDNVSHGFVSDGVVAARDISGRSVDSAGALPDTSRPGMIYIGGSLPTAHLL